MSEFRILNENTFSLKGNKLYVMLLRENGNFGVEVVDRHKTFGRKFAEDKQEADALFEIITQKISLCKSLEEAEQMIESSFKRKNTKETLFLLLVKDAKLSQEDFGKLVAKFKLKVKPKYNFLLDKRKMFSFFQVYFNANILILIF